MKKFVIVINGRGGVGKDTITEFAGASWRVRNVSSVDFVKEIAKLCGWDGNKTPKSRELLSDLKRVMTEYNDLPTVKMIEAVKELVASDDEILFVHIREPQDIAKFVAAAKELGGVNIRTLLVRRQDAPEFSGYSGDAHVEEYEYDWYYDNDLPIEQAKGDFTAKLAAWLGESVKK